MELNLSYEQSKEILELGYDFSSICTKSELKTDTEYRVVYGRPVERGSRKEIESSESMEGDGRIVHLRNRSMLDPLMIPIIPEAALLKCFPDLEEEPHIKNARVWLGKDLYLDSEDCIYLGDIDGDGIGYGSYFLERLKDQEFKSGYEAFLWCHRHYPEKLKAKFTKELKM